MALRTRSGIIQLMDNILVEVEVPESRAISISSSYANRVNSSLSSIALLIHQVSEQVVNSLKTATQSDNIIRAEVEFGINYAEEGEVYLTRSRAESNISVKLTIEHNKNT